MPSWGGKHWQINRFNLHSVVHFCFLKQVMLLHMTACQSVQRYSQPYSQIPRLPTEAEILPYILKCLRQLADSGWFGSNWNTRDRERVRDSSPVLMEYSWTWCQDWSCSIKRAFASESLISFINQFLERGTEAQDESLNMHVYIVKAYMYHCAWQFS